MPSKRKSWTLKGQKAFMINRPEIDVSVVITRKQILDAFKGVKVESLEAVEGSQALFSFKNIKGDKYTGPIVYFIDVRVTKTDSMFNKLFGFLGDAFKTNRFAFESTPLKVDYIELRDILSMYTSFMQRLIIKEETTEAVLFGYFVISAIADSESTQNPIFFYANTEQMEKVHQERWNSIREKIAVAYKKGKGLSPEQVAALTAQASESKIKLEEQFRKQIDVNVQDLIADMSRLQLIC